MPVLTDRQVAGFVEGMGVPRGTTVAEWVALARRESSFNTEATNPRPCPGNGRCHIGLWQIQDTHRERINLGGIHVPRERAEFRSWLKGHFQNWMAAKWVYEQQGWGAWVASHSPTAADRAAAADPDYSVYGQGAGTIDPKTGRPHPGGEPGVEEEPFHTAAEALDPLAAVGRALGQMVEIIVAAGVWLTDTHNLIRIAFVAGGAGAALVALGIVAKPQLESTLKAIRP